MLMLQFKYTKLLDTKPIECTEMSSALIISFAVGKMVLILLKWPKIRMHIKHMCHCCCSYGVVNGEKLGSYYEMGLKGWAWHERNNQ